MPTLGFLEEGLFDVEPEKHSFQERPLCALRVHSPVIDLVVPCVPRVSAVCQETVWEAFKIFWDRLPEQQEYQSWMNQCQEGVATARDIGTYFSQSEEHQGVIKKVCGKANIGITRSRKCAEQRICKRPNPQCQKRTY